MKFCVSFIVALCLFLTHTMAMALDESDLQSEVVQVLRVSDGDTINVLRSDQTEVMVRFIAVQAFEEHDADSASVPDCNATNATDRLADILGCDVATDNCPTRPEVTLKVWDTSLTSGHRLLRYVFMDDGSGGEINIGLQLVKEGYVLAWPSLVETLYNRELWLAQDNAMKKQIGPLWNSNESQCSGGPGEGVQLEMWANWDAPGDDSLEENRNGEWIKIKNKDSTPVNLSHWVVRDIGQQDPFRFPAGTTLPAGESVTVYVGEGTNDGTNFFMNESRTILVNSVPDGVLLLDYWGGYGVAGEIISTFTYPCIKDCSDPLQGRISLHANYDADGDDGKNPNGEWVDIKNVSSGVANMEKYLLHSDPEGSAVFNFDEDSTIHPGETMRVYIGQGNDSRLIKYWGNETSILNNTKDRVWIDTYDAIMIASHSWPDSSGPTESTGFSPASLLLLLSR